MILFQLNRFIVLAFQSVGGIRTMNAAFFHGFIFPDVSFRKLAVLFDEHRQSQPNECQAQQNDYDDENGK